MSIHQLGSKNIWVILELQILDSPDVDPKDVGSFVGAVALCGFVGPELHPKEMKTLNRFFFVNKTEFVRWNTKV